MKSTSKRKVNLKKVAKVWYHRVIRLRYADEDGYCECVTCGERKHFKKMHAGHFKHGLDFIDDNMHPQCVGCNTYRGGRLDIYTLFMIDTYGRERVEELQRLKNKGQKYSKSEYKEMIERFKDEAKKKAYEKGQLL